MNQQIDAPYEIHNGADDDEILEAEAKASRAALALREGGPLQPVGTDRVFALTHPNIEKMMQRRDKVLQNLRQAAIKATVPEDWTLFKGKEGEPFGIAGRSGCTKIGVLWGVQILNPTSVDIRTDDDGRKVAECYGDAYCALTGQVFPGMRGYRVDGEQFVGRSPEKVGTEDLRQSARTSLENKAVRALTGLVRVTLSELATAWGITPQAAEAKCIHGSGYGSAAQRGNASAGEAPAGNGDYVSEAQGKRAYAIASKRARELDAEGVDARVILKQVARDMGIPEGGKIKRSQYDAYIERVSNFEIPQGV